MNISLFPMFNPTTKKLENGTAVQTSSFCQKAIHTKPECLQHYESLREKGEGFYQCPFGMTSRNFYHRGQPLVITGVIAFPRFGTKAEQQMARRFPEIRVARTSIDKNVGFLKDIEQARAAAIQEAAQVLPQALHELRKLNGAILQHAEREINDRGELPGLLSIKSAAELMRNNFDILEALSNIDSMKALPLDATINLFDLVYKTKRVLAERASSRSMQIHVDGVRAIIPGNQKSFPIVPAVLLENAIKYGQTRTLIRVEVSAIKDKAILTVENETDHFIDSSRCFEKGVRFSDAVEGGGFGLFLAKEIVTSHKGIIQCEFVKGTVRMTVELPLVNVIPQKS
jgi:signal transduction histidine kinase